MGLLDYLNVVPAVIKQANTDTDTPAPPPPTLNEKPALPDFAKAKPATGSSDSVDYDRLIREKGYHGAFLAMNQKPDFETEEKHLRRSRELALLGDIANLGGQALASGMGARRFAPIQSQVPQYLEKLQRLRDAQRDYDMDFNNKSLSMVFKDYERKWANEAAARNQSWDQYKYNTDFKYKAEKDKNNAELKQKELEAKEKHYRVIEENGRINASANATKANTAAASQSKVADSVIGSDGNIYTRNSRLTPNEARQIVLGSGISQEDLTPFVIEEKDYLGNVTKSQTDYNAAAAYLFQKGMISTDVLAGMGFKPGNKSANSGKNVSGFGASNKGKKTVKGF